VLRSSADVQLCDSEFLPTEEALTLKAFTDVASGALRVVDLSGDRDLRAARQSWMKHDRQATQINGHNVSDPVQHISGLHLLRTKSR